MADASCGPSNAFKGLARHIEQDRSHQQDRVGPGSQQPAQNFRSMPLNSASGDQFRAFQQQHALLPEYAANGQLLSHLPPHPAQASTLFPPQPMQQQAAFGQSGSGSWVNDFQRMNFSDAHARPLHSHSIRGPVIGQPIHSNFSPVQHPAFQPYQPLSTGLHPMQPMQSMQPPFSAFQPGNNMHASQSMDDATLGLNAQAEADLGQEFADAMDEWMLQNGPEEDVTASIEDASAESTVHEAIKEESEVNEEQETELARAAQQLVDLLADNDTEKFKNSEFISLMRRIASRQLTVQGNDLVESSPPPPSTDTSTVSATP